MVIRNIKTQSQLCFLICTEFDKGLNASATKVKCNCHSVYLQMRRVSCEELAAVTMVVVTAAQILELALLPTTLLTLRVVVEGRQVEGEQERKVGVVEEELAGEVVGMEKEVVVGEMKRAVGRQEWKRRRAVMSLPVTLVKGKSLLVLLNIQFLL